VEIQLTRPEIQSECSQSASKAIAARPHPTIMSDTEAELVSGEEIARWLGLSGKEIYDLGKAGILVRVGRAYRLQQSVRRYCHYLRQELAKDNAEPISSIDARLG
jgi:biotin operon repressor